jgi:hypothetical protein
MGNKFKPTNIPPIDEIDVSAVVEKYNLAGCYPRQ